MKYEWVRTKRPQDGNPHSSTTSRKWRLQQNHRSLKHPSKPFRATGEPPSRTNHLPRLKLVQPYKLEPGLGFVNFILIKKVIRIVTLVKVLTIIWITTGSRIEWPIDLSWWCPHHSTGTATAAASSLLEGAFQTLNPFFGLLQLALDLAVTSKVWSSKSFLQIIKNDKTSVRHLTLISSRTVGGPTFTSYTFSNTLAYS